MAKSCDQVAWDLFWRSQNTVEIQCVYYIEMTRKAVLLHTSEQEGGGYDMTDKQGESAHGIQLDQGDRFIYSNRSSLQGINMQGKKFTAEHSACTVNTWIWFPRVGFAILLCLKLWGL